MTEHSPESTLVPLVGSRAPAFDLPATGPVPRVRLGQYLDRWVVLIFYPRDFSLVCPTELTALSRRMDEFLARDCTLLGISTDSLDTHQRWIQTPRGSGGVGDLQFPLASDADGSTSRAYGVYLQRQHVALRGLFVIDPNGVIQYQVVHNLSVGRSVDELLRVLDALQSGGMCPEAWSPGQTPLDPLRVLGPNHVVGTYRIEQELGRGAFGVVYRAWDTVLARPVALKVLRTDASRPADVLLNEARSAAALNHPNICTIFTVDSSSGVPVIVMELVEGRSLDRLLAERRLDRETALSLARQIASGLASAHAVGFAHGDLKPANVLVRTDGTAKLLDFGLARKATREELAETVVSEPGIPGITGTPAYLAPEQWRGMPATPASDVYSLGLIVVELLTGQRALPGTDIVDILRTHDQLNVESLLTSWPPPDASLVRRLLARDPADRVSAEVAVRDLDQLV